MHVGCSRFQANSPPAICGGQSLVVWAVSEGRKAARAVDLYLMGE